MSEGFGITDPQLPLLLRIVYSSEAEGRIEKQCRDASAEIRMQSAFTLDPREIRAQKNTNAVHCKWLRIPNSHLSSDSMRILKWPLSPYRDKWHKAYNELQAMRTLKKKVLEVENPTANFLAILNDSFHKYGTDPSPSAYSFIIKYLSHRHLFSHLHLILDHLEKAERLELPEKIFVSLIQYYGKLGLLQDAINIFYRVPKFQCIPSVLSLNSLLSVLCKREEGLGLVRDVLMNSLEMRIRLEASTFRILIRALCRNGKVSSAVELLNLMQLDECTPDSRMYSQVLNSLCKHGEVTEVMDFLEVMRSAGLLPDTSDYNSVIDALVRTGKGDYAYSVLTKMKSEGKRPDISSYNSVLNGFLLENDFLKVDELFDEVLMMGLVPNVSTYNTYIDGLCRQGDFKRACRMVVCMEKAGCMADASTFNVLISGYAKAGEMGKAREMMNEMLLKGLRWNTHTYESVIAGLIRKDEIPQAHELLTEMLGKGYVPQASTFNSLACNLCKKGHLCEVLQILDEMLNRSISPDAALWEALVVGYRLNQVGFPVNLDMTVLGSSP